MKLKAVEIENFRAIEKLTLSLDPQLTVLHGAVVAFKLAPQPSREALIE